MKRDTKLPSVKMLYRLFDYYPERGEERAKERAKDSQFQRLMRMVRE